MSEIKLNVPYISQHRDIISEEWKSKACSITCLAMAINYFKQDNNSLFFEKDFNLNVNDILNDAIEFNFYDEKIGYWLHNKISLLPHNYGVSAYAEEFRSRKLGRKTEFEENIRRLGIRKIIKNILENKLVIFSMPKDWEHEDKYHSSLFVGIKFKNEFNLKEKELENNFENILDNVTGFYYHDPNFENEENGAFKYIELEKFVQYWRGLAIFVG